jgi:hypothetical protein
VIFKIPKQNIDIESPFSLRDEEYIPQEDEG